MPSPAGIAECSTVAELIDAEWAVQCHQRVCAERGMGWASVWAETAPLRGAVVDRLHRLGEADPGVVVEVVALGRRFDVHGGPVPADEPAPGTRDAAAAALVRAAWLDASLHLFEDGSTRALGPFAVLEGVRGENRDATRRPSTRGR